MSDLFIAGSFTLFNGRQFFAAEFEEGDEAFANMLIFYSQDITEAWADDLPVRVRSTGTLPEGLDDATTYYLGEVTYDDENGWSTCKLLDGPGGTEIDITDDVGGAHYIGPDFTPAGNLGIATNGLVAFAESTGAWADASSGATLSIRYFAVVGTTLYGATSSQIFQWSASGQAWTELPRPSVEIYGIAAYDGDLIAFGNVTVNATAFLKTSLGARIRTPCGAVYASKRREPRGRIEVWDPGDGAWDVLTSPEASVVTAVAINGTTIWATLRTYDGVGFAGKYTGSWVYSLPGHVYGAYNALALWNGGLYLASNQTPFSLRKWTGVDDDPLLPMDANFTSLDPEAVPGVGISAPVSFLGVVDSQLFILAPSQTGYYLHIYDEPGDMPAGPYTHAFRFRQGTAYGVVGHTIDMTFTVDGQDLTVPSMESNLVSVGEAAEYIADLLNASVLPEFAAFTWSWSPGGHISAVSDDPVMAAVEVTLEYSSAPGLDFAPEYHEARYPVASVTLLDTDEITVDDMDGGLQTASNPVAALYGSAVLVAPSGRLGDGTAGDGGYIKAWDGSNWLNFDESFGAPTGVTGIVDTSGVTLT